MVGLFKINESPNDEDQLEFSLSQKDLNGLDEITAFEGTSIILPGIPAGGLHASVKSP
jgi:hypothetical protein